MTNNENTFKGLEALPIEKLTQPAILLLLAQDNSHGYDIIQKLNQIECIEGETEAATVYRTLRKMEQDGLVESKWEHGEFGPARRKYQLTDSGWKTLDLWVEGLKRRINQIEAFINFYDNLKR